MTQPAGLASLDPGTGTVLHGRGQLGSIRRKTSPLLAFSFLAVLILCGGGYTVYILFKLDKRKGIPVPIPRVHGLSFFLLSLNSFSYYGI